MKNFEFIEKLKCDRNLSDDEFKVCWKAMHLMNIFTEQPTKNVGAFMAMKYISED